MTALSERRIYSRELAERTAAYRSAMIVQTLARDSGEGGSVLQLAEAMKSIGHPVTVLTAEDRTNGTASDLAVMTPSNSFALPARFEKARSKSLKELLRIASSVVQFICWQGRALRLGDFAISNTATSLALDGDILTPRSSIRFARRLQGNDTDIGRDPLYWLYASVETWNMRAPHDAVIALSHLQKRALIEIFQLPKDGVTVIYNGIDSKRFHPNNRDCFRAAFCNEQGINNKTFVIGFIGEDFESKGLDVALQALAHPLVCGEEWRFAVVGGGNIQSYEQVAKKLGIRGKVSFLGHREDTERILGACDAFVFPTYADTFGKAPTEAMATGVPVIVSAHAGSAEWVENGAGFVVSEQTPLEYATHIFNLLTHTQLRRQMGQLSRQVVEGYTWEKAARQTLELYNEILQRRQASR